jgi:hypothetical protein
MSRSEISTEFNTFVGGILTEANPINYPPGYSLDEENFILLTNGTRERRCGLTLEATATDLLNSDSRTYQSSLLWENCGNNRDPIDCLRYIDQVDSSGTRLYTNSTLLNLSSPLAISANVELASAGVAGDLAHTSTIYKGGVVEVSHFNRRVASQGSWWGGGASASITHHVYPKFLGYDESSGATHSRFKIPSEYPIFGFHFRQFQDYVGTLTGNRSASPTVADPIADADYNSLHYNLHPQ